jgi:Ricin-type beta-trefoil lectin domain
MRTRTRVAAYAVALAATGGLVAVTGFAVVGHGQPATSAATRAVARPSPSASSPGRANSATRPGASGPARALRLPSAAPSSVGNSQPNAAPAAAAAPAVAAAPPAAPPLAGTSSSPTYTTIDNEARGPCLNAMSTANTAQVDVASCNGSWYQEWLGLEAGSAEQVVNKQSGLCLTAKSVANGADVDISTCQGSQNQLWIPNGASLEVGSSGICLNATTSSNHPNTWNVGVATCGSGTSEQWSW